MTYNIYYVQYKFNGDALESRKVIEHTLDNYELALDLLIKLNSKSQKEYRLDSIGE